jgi:antirestriction protein ArdC
MVISNMALNNKVAYEMLTRKYITLIESGKLTWNKQWANVTAPMNGATHYAYKGFLNILSTWGRYDSNCWYTFAQVKKLGGNVKKDEHATPIFSWFPYQVDSGHMVEKDGVMVPEKKTIMLMKVFDEFNYEQCEGLPEPKKIAPKEKIPSCEELLNGMKEQPVIMPAIADQNNAYSPALDMIFLRDRREFFTSGAYYQTRFHETIHWTGNEKRLARTFGPKFGDELYSYEELIACLGASFLAAKCQIDTTQMQENNAAYMQHWASFLKENPARTLMDAMRDAQKAVELITGESQTGTTAAPAKAPASDVQAIPA